MPDFSRPPSRYTREEIEAKIASRPFWYHTIELAEGLLTPGYSNSIAARDLLGWPDRLDGLSVLDIGAAEGFFSFEAERRGARVTAVDRVHADDSGFALVRDILNSQVTHHQLSVYNLDPKTLGQFDYVLFLGVFYHLRYPLLGLDILRDLCRGTLILETQVCDEHWVLPGGQIGQLKELAPKLTATPLAQFYPNDELNGDRTNWWAPNCKGMEDMLTSAGFSPKLHRFTGGRAIFHAHIADRGTESARWAKLEHDSVQRPWS